MTSSKYGFIYGYSVLVYCAAAVGISSVRVNSVIYAPYGCSIRFPNFSSSEINMSPIDKKRKIADVNHKSGKRLQPDSTDAAFLQSGAKKTVTSLEILPWTQVPIPDRFEDAEGFFGLEEIEDVEIVRDEKLGRLEYRVGKGSCDRSLLYAVPNLHSTNPILQNGRAHC